MNKTIKKSLDNQLREKLLQQLNAIVSEEHVLIDDTAESFYTDVYRQQATPIAVVQVSTLEQIQRVVELASNQKIQITVRGGGASYTDGYLPSSTDSILLDLSRFNRIIAINEQDFYVTVEAGVTWQQLKQELDARQLRTPFWGPFSGLHATIGGSVSQHTVSHGSGAHGISAQSVLSMDIVLGDGSLLQTGSASAGLPPFARHFGPDITGLFTGDCSALGIKAHITLPLIRQRPAHRNLSFAFPDFDTMHESMRIIAAERLEDTHLALDGALSQGQIARQESPGAMIKMALSILASSPSWFEGLSQLCKAALFGKRVISKSPYMTHYIVEGVSDQEVKARLQRIRQLNQGLGKEIPATVPSVVRGMPFAPFFNTLGPSGERWVPLHGILPHSACAAFHLELEKFFNCHKQKMDELGIWYGGMFATIGSSGFLYELALYWPDEITAYHRQVIPDEYLSNLPTYPANPMAREFVDQLKQDLIALYCKHQAVNFQLGKAYPYASRLQASSLSLIKVLKQNTDPDFVIAPGNLEL
ncbi:MAG: FAD-binding oxidoreductase [Rickettsiales bacterium]